LGNHGLHLVFQLGNGRLLFLDFLMLFEELIKQHCVDLLVANGVGFSVVAQHYQGRIHLFYFFSNQAKTGRPGLVALVVEGHWSKRKDRFTALAHGFNVVLEPRRGTDGTKLVVRANEYGQIAGANASTTDTTEKHLRGSTSYGWTVGGDA